MENGRKRRDRKNLIALTGAAALLAVGVNLAVTALKTHLKNRRRKGTARSRTHTFPSVFVCLCIYSWFLSCALLQKNRAHLVICCVAFPLCVKISSCKVFYVWKWGWSWVGEGFGCFMNYDVENSIWSEQFPIFLLQCFHLRIRFEE